MNDRIRTGNAHEDARPYRGWLVGHFVTERDARQTDEVEIGWRSFPAGQARPVWVRGEVRTTIVILVRGRFRVQFADADGDLGAVTLEQEGDYATWPPGVDHCWEALEDTVMITVRWPSLSGHDHGVPGGQPAANVRAGRSPDGSGAPTS
jgi:quercetin dioxygenase-like cupin family protein